MLSYGQSSGEPVACSSEETAPIEVCAQFFSGINEPRPVSLDFSLDGLFAISAHLDDAVRVMNVTTLAHCETIHCPSFGVSSSCFTQSPSVICVAPRLPIDGHLHLLNLETATFIGALAYINDFEAEIQVLQKPVYSTIAQCPCTDVIGAVIGAKGTLALFHPLVSGAVAVTREKFVKGEKPPISFDTNGYHIYVGGDDAISVLDRRSLGRGPITSFQTKNVFLHDPYRCRGVESSVEQGRLLVTSSGGEANIFNWHTEVLESTYFHHDVQSLFLGAPNHVPARYLTPGVSQSRVAQMTSSMNDGRHVLVYYPTPASEEAKVKKEKDEASKIMRKDSVQEGRLQYQLQLKDSELPVSFIVNPRFKMFGTAARHVTWWSFGE